MAGKRPDHKAGKSTTLTVAGASARHTLNSDTYCIEVFATMGGTQVKLGDSSVAIGSLGEAGTIPIPIQEPDVHMTGKPDANANATKSTHVAYAGNGGQITITEYYSADAVYAW